MSEPVYRRTRLRAGMSLAILMACTVSAPLMAATDPAPAATASTTSIYAIESAKAARGLLLDIAHAGARLVAVGDHGHILYSDDQGKSWVQARVPTRQLLTAVYFVDEQHGWAVGHDAQILASSDGGKSWNKQFEDLAREAPLLDVWFKDLQNGLAIGAYGALLATTDGGQHWEDVSDRLDNEDQYHLNGIAQVKDAGLFIVGEAAACFAPMMKGRPGKSLTVPIRARCSG